MIVNGFTYSEAKLSERLGISRTDIKAIRDRVLSADGDWKKVGGEVVLSASGIKRLWRTLKTRPEAFDLESCLISTAGEKNGAVGNGDAGAAVLLGHATMLIPVEMTVTRICLNPALIQAQPTSGLDRRTVNVWVGLNRYFAVGMRIPVAPKKNTPGVWVLVSAAPRRNYSAGEWNRMQTGAPK